MEIGKESVEFLGYIISKNKIESLINKSDAIQNYPVPKNQDELRKFLGIVNYYRKFIKNCADKTVPLLKLLKKKQEFCWEEEQKETFNNLKKELTSKNCLHQPDFEKSFILTTDASNTGLGAVLSQMENNKEITIAYASRKLSDAEKNYSITEKEMLGALWAMEHFQYFLLGRKFLIQTDHKALEAFNTKGRINSARISRWMERIQMFDFDILYKKPEDLMHVDALSRSKSGVNLTIDKEKEEEIMKAQSNLVHRGAKATYEYLKQNNSNLMISMSHVKNVLRRCYKCKEYNTIRIEGFRYVEAFEPGEKVAIDIIGPWDGKFILTAIDYFSRFAMAKVIKEKSSERLIKFLEIVHKKLNVKMLVSDGARENTSELVGNWVCENNINHHITSAYHHCSNGRIERFNKTLGEAVKKQDNKLSFKKKVENAITAYNDTIHSAICITPNEVLMFENMTDLRKKQFNNRVDKYKKLFKTKMQKKLQLNDMVLIEDAIHKRKGQKKFLEIGEVIGVLANDTYWVAKGNKIAKRHVTQLRKINEDDFFL